MHNFDLSIDDITKIEGSAALSIKVRDNQVKEVNFKITDHKRFFTQAMRGKSIIAIPQLLSRICGTCSNAHLLCSIKAIENALNIQPSRQTKILRELVTYGLMIRDHTLHLGIFVLPDLFNKDSIFDFDENDKEQYLLLEDIFNLKSAGNYLSVITGGRSVHAPNPVIGGFLKFPKEDEIERAIIKLEKVRPAALKLINIFKDCLFRLENQRKYVSLASDNFNFLDGVVKTSDGEVIDQNKIGGYLEHVVIPYSEASGYKFKGKDYMVGALARINLAKEKLHPRTRTDTASVLSRFPSENIFDNNLAQAIEILHSIDSAVEILRNNKFDSEDLIKYTPAESIGIGVIEAPRGTLYHKLEIDFAGRIKSGQIVVPTGQNQISIEKDISLLVNNNITLERGKLEFEIEKLIRAYDPCMSCATHFLTIKWN